MDELTLLRAFFAKWEALHAIPKDGKREEKEFAAQHMVDTAQAIRAARKAAAPPDPSEFRAMQQVVAAIKPKDGFAKNAGNVG